MVEEIVPAVVGAYLRADRKTLDYWCVVAGTTQHLVRVGAHRFLCSQQCFCVLMGFRLSEDAYARTNAALKARDVAGLIVDPNLLEVSSCEVVSAKVRMCGDRCPTDGHCGRASLTVLRVTLRGGCACVWSWSWSAGARAR